MPQRDDELESHLADRLKETRDVANFSRGSGPQGSKEVERTYALPEHLGGRTISDKFVRGGATPAPRPVDDEAPKPKGLEHHLKSRLAEVQDIGPGQGSDIDRMLDAYRKRRRDLGGIMKPVGRWMLGAAVVLSALPCLPAWAYPANADVRAVLDHEAVRRGVCDLFQAAKSGHPSLLQDAEREIVAGLLDGLEASTVGGRVNAERYQHVLDAYDEAQHLFKELPYALEVDPGDGLRPFTLPLRRNPMWDVASRPPQGWQVEVIESGARLVARGS